MDYNKGIENDTKIPLKAIFKNYLRHWKLFLVSLVVFIGLGLLFCYLKSPVYAIHSSVAMNDNQENSSGPLSGSLSGLMSSFSIGGLGHKSAEDEMYKISSHTNVAEAVRRLGLNYQYRRKDNLLSPSTWYYRDSPIVVDIPREIADTFHVSTKLNVKIKDAGKQITVSGKQGKAKLPEKTYTHFPFQYKTPLGTFRVDATPYYNPQEDMTIRVFITSPDIAAHMYDEKFSAQQYTKKSNIIQLYREDEIVERGQDFLAALVDVYNERSVDQKQEFAGHTIEFIDSRLKDLYSELESSESQIERYKRSNQIVEPEAEAEYMFKKRGTIEAELVELETKRGVLRMITEFLRSDNNKYSLIPFTENLPSSPIETYNELVLERLKLVNNTKANTSAIKTISAQIDATRENLLLSLDRELAATGIAIADIGRADASSKSRMTEYPTMEKELFALYRDQKIRNQIYAFLLQKREENELARTRTTPPGTVVDTPYADRKPVAPKKGLVIGLMGIVGLVVPIVGISTGLVGARRIRKVSEEQV